MSRGKLIVIEGSDGSGKQTQTQLLVDRLQQHYPGKVATFSFPHYDKPFGQEIKKYLGGIYGDFNYFDKALEEMYYISDHNLHIEIALRNGKRIHAYFASLLYVMDRWLDKDGLHSALEKNTFAVCDRYDISNWAHQSAKLDEFSGEVLIYFLKNIEREVIGIPIPDHVFYLDLPRDHAHAAIQNRSSLDIHEKALDYQEKVRQTYLKLAQQEGWTLIDCLRPETRERKTREEISDEIWRHLMLP